MQSCLQYSQLGAGKYICREHMISTTQNYTLLFAVRIITNEATNQISFKYQYKNVKRNDEN